jgi:hypothetical protein
VLWQQIKQPWCYMYILVFPRAVVPNVGFPEAVALHAVFQRSVVPYVVFFPNPRAQSNLVARGFDTCQNAAVSDSSGILIYKTPRLPLLSSLLICPHFKLHEVLCSDLSVLSSFHHELTSSALPPRSPTTNLPVQHAHLQKVRLVP